MPKLASVDIGMVPTTWTSPGSARASPAGRGTGEQLAAGRVGQPLVQRRVAGQRCGDRGGVEVERVRVREVARRRTDVQDELARLDAPSARARSTRTRTRGRRARSGPRPMRPARARPCAKPFSSRTGRATGFGVGDVDLDDLGAGPAAGVGDRHGDLDAQVACLDRAGDRRPSGRRRPRRGVGQPEPERVAHGEAERVVGAVADEHPLAVADELGVAGEVEVRRVVLEPHRDGLGELAGRVRRADSRSATAPPAAWPASQHSRIAATLSSQVDVRTTDPLASTTTTRSLTSATGRTSSSWSAGRSMCGAVEALRLGRRGQPEEEHDVSAPSASSRASRERGRRRCSRRRGRTRRRSAPRRRRRARRAARRAGRRPRSG